MKSNRLAIKRTLDEIIKSPTGRTQYQVESSDVRGNKVVHKYSMISEIWYFPYGEAISIESVRGRIFGRHNVRSAFKM